MILDKSCEGSIVTERAIGSSVVPLGPLARSEAGDGDIQNQGMHILCNVGSCRFLHGDRGWL